MDSSDVENPGNNLYVTGLSARVTDRDLEKHFSAEGEVTFIEYLQRDTKIVYNFLSSPYYRLLTLAKYLIHGQGNPGDLDLLPWLLLRRLIFASNI